MSTCFSSLKNLNLLINNLVDTKDDTLPLKYINKLVNDLTKLLNESDFYDVEIRVGVDEDVKIFKAHSSILKARSSYFKTALSNKWIKKSDDGVILFEKENISPNVFEVLLTYIYNGALDINNLNANEIFELIEACDELNFNELIKDLQSYMINKEKKWVQQNLIYVYKIASHHQLFDVLQDYCSEIIHKNPESIFKSKDFKDIEKPMLITMLEKEGLKLGEIEIWDNIIQWGKNQNEKLDKDVSEWMKEDFIMLKNILNDIIPLIRFYEISSVDFYDKIKPYKKVIDKETYEELLQYHVTHRLQPRLILQKGPRSKIRTRKLLNSQMKSLISNWIDCKNDLYNENNVPYEFELILQGTQDGFSRSVFKNECYNIKQTVAIMKIKDTGELVGGYNPVGWNIKEKSLDDGYWIETNKSFIFKIDENQINKSILSKVMEPRYAIYHNRQSINEIVDDMEFHEMTINFYNLCLCNSINNDPYCYYRYHSSSSGNSYKNDLNLRNKKNKNENIYLVEECEVYEIVKKN